MPERSAKRATTKATKPARERAKTLAASEQAAGEPVAPTRRAKAPPEPTGAPPADKPARAKKPRSAPEEGAKKEADAPGPAPAADGGTRPTLHAVWTGTLSFGLVAIPVELFPATRNGRVSLRMLAEDGTPLVRRSFDETGRMLDKSDITRGYEVEKDAFVEVTDEELDALAPEEGRDIKLNVFVERLAISPLYFERGYVLAPGKGTNSAYRLLAHTMEKTGHVGIATFVMHDTEHLVCILSEHGVLRGQLLRFQSEVRTPDSLGLPARSEPGEALLAAARRALDALERGGREGVLPHDAYREKLEALAEAKLKSGTDVLTARATPAEDDTPTEELADVVDLVAVLRRSLAAGGGAKKPRG